MNLYLIFDVEIIFTQKLQVNFTNNYKEMASNTELNVIF